MTADVFGDAPEVGDGQIDPLSPEHVVTLVRFLASPAAKDVNGQVFIVYGPKVTLVSAPTVERQFPPTRRRGSRASSATSYRITLLDVTRNATSRRPD